MTHMNKHILNHYSGFKAKLALKSYAVAYFKQTRQCSIVPQFRQVHYAHIRIPFSLSKFLPDPHAHPQQNT